MPRDSYLDMLLALGPGASPVWRVTEDSSRTKRGAPFWVFEATLALRSRR